MKSGQRVLVQAGSGGVGSWIVQLAKIQGLHVTATCSTPSVTFVKQVRLSVTDLKLCYSPSFQPFPLVWATLEVGWSHKLTHATH